MSDKWHSFIDSVQDSSPENRELAEILRKLEELSPSSECIDWQESRKRCVDLLDRLAGSCPKSEALKQRLEGAEIIVGGSEHILISLEDEHERIFKATFDDNFGCHSEFFERDHEGLGKHFYATGNADPFFYLRRWICLNSIGGYQTRYEGILPPKVQGQLPRICVSQRVLEGGNPDFLKVEKALLPYGFFKISEDAFLNPDTEILLTDLAPRNVRIIDNIPVPFDAIAELASPKVMEWSTNKLKGRV